MPSHSPSHGSTPPSRRPERKPSHAATSPPSPDPGSNAPASQTPARTDAGGTDAAEVRHTAHPAARTDAGATDRGRAEDLASSSNPAEPGKPSYCLPPAQSLSRRASRAAQQPISRLMQLALERPQLISLAAGFVSPDSLPIDSVRHAVLRLLANTPAAQAALQYGTTAGYPPLREALLARQLALDGLTPAQARLSVEQVVVTAGSNQLLHLLVDILCDEGDIVLCSAPSYFVFLGILGHLGVRAVGVECDAEGLIPEALEERLRFLESQGELERVRAVYVVSYFDNPRGISLARQRRAAVVELVRRWSRHGRIRLIEDMAYRLLRYEGGDLPSLRSYDPDGLTVIATDTFSKCFSPGIRVGWGLLPPDLVGPVCETKGNIDFGSPNFAQHLMAEVAAHGGLQPQVERVCADYRVRLAAMLRACDEHLGRLAGVSWVRPQGGLYVWVVLPEHVKTGPEGPLFAAALDEGVLYVPGGFCFPPEGTAPGTHTMRLSFGVQPCERLEQGVAALARALAKVL